MFMKKDITLFELMNTFNTLNSHQKYHIAEDKNKK